MPRAPVLAAALMTSLFLGAGCDVSARSPEEAYQRFARAALADDPIALFGCLDRRSRDDLAAALHDEALERTIISAKYPAAEARAALAPLERGRETDVEHYFARWAREHELLAGYRAQIDSRSPLQNGRFPFVASGGRWSFAGLDVQARREREHAWNSLQTVRENARLYAEAH